MPEPNINTEQEINWARQRLELLDRNIRFPQSLSSHALLHKLDGIESKPFRRFSWPQGLLSLQSGVSYAIAFALIIVVFYAVQLNNPQAVIDGQFVVEESTGASSLLEMEPFAASVLDAPDASRAALQTDASPNDVSPGFTSVIDAEVPDLAYGVGGANPTHILGEAGGYTLTWRTNDPSDPDAEGAITLAIVDRSDDRVAAEIGIFDMTSITNFSVEGDRMVLTGSDDMDTVVRSYRGFETQTLSPEASLSLPGSHVGTRLFQGYVYMVTFELPANPERSIAELLQLPRSLDVGICYVGSLNPDTGDSYIAGYRDSGGDIALFDHHLYISYSGVAQDDSSKQERYVAQVTLDGPNIILSQIL